MQKGFGSETNRTEEIKRSQQISLKKIIEYNDEKVKYQGIIAWLGVGVPASEFYVSGSGYGEFWLFSNLGRAGVVIL